MVKREFSLDKYYETMNWANSMMAEINEMLLKYAEVEEEWIPFQQFFWCRNICGVRRFCEYEEAENGLI